MPERRIHLFGQAYLVVNVDSAGRRVGAIGIEGYLDEVVGRMRLGPAPLLSSVANILRASFRKQFAAGGEPQWAPLRPSTVRRKQAAIGAARIPRRTPSGRIPRRLMQVNRQTGAREFSAMTILIATGALRDSWCVKGARGNVEDVSGNSVFVGSQLTVETEIAPDKPVKHYHVLSKKAVAARRRGQAVRAKVPLARIHQQGAPGASIPARPLTVPQEDLDLIVAASKDWIAGSTS